MSACAVGARAAEVEVVVDPLDGTLWVCLPSPAAVTAALSGLRGHGLGTTGVNDHRLHLTDWNVDYCGGGSGFCSPRWMTSPPRRI